MKNIIFLTSLLTLMFACRPNKQRDISNAEYVEIALDSIEFYSIHKNTYNFDSLKSNILTQINDSTKREVVIELLNYAIDEVDIHSYILTKDQYKNLETGKAQPHKYPFQGEMIDGKYALLTLDGFKGVDSTSSDNYADSLQRLLLHLHNKKPIGWIVDLRNNTGGWEYPMIAGLGPLLGEGILAYEVNRDGKIENEYSYAKLNQKSILTKQIELIDSVVIFNEKPSIVVLIGNETGSAGELLTLCFLDNPNTILLGTPTNGVPTGIAGFFMPDSTMICVTSSVFKNRNMKGNGKPVQPYIYESDNTEILSRAYKWIDENR
ncbi:S41 family peptidase [Cognataquiflexum aquatile]|uniref:S41 family peptidase n=1 Tax=Cognataquiflexum aquatile TaxID=2249427 RepID=UPI000DEB080D|nr:S41 family peptidase [Cognataquiflexum aquatile]